MFSRRKPHTVYCCASIPVLHMAKVAPESNENSCTGMRTGWTDLSVHWDLFWAQPWPSPRAFLPASQISVHRRNNSKNLCGFFCMWNYFSTAAHIVLCMGARACNSAWCFDSSPSSVIYSRESEQAEHRDSVATGKSDMSRQYRARHRCVAAEIACSRTSSSSSSSSSEFQISLWKVFLKWLFVELFCFSSPSSAMSYYFGHVWGSIGAEKGNYAVSDLCMTVGFGLGLRVGSSMTETQLQRGCFSSWV